MVDIYKWIETHPKTSIAAAIKRIQKIFDESDEILIGFSGGKDSALTIQLCIMELKRRKEIKDKRWINKKLFVNFMHSEWLYSDVISFVNKFVKDNKDYINCFYKCLQLGWNSGVTFGDDRLISWDENKKDKWITPMPKKKETYFDVITNKNIKEANKVKFDELSEDLKELRRLEGFKEGDLVPHFGLGNRDINKEYDCWTFPGENEDFEQETFGAWFIEGFPKNYILYNLVSIRAEESFDRYTILKQSDFSTGQYGYQKAKNGNRIKISSPIFDMKTADIWRCMSACDFEYPEIYDKMYEAGVPIGKQRIASLLHTCGVRNINQLRDLEPVLYRRISSRFQNIDFISQFVKSGYYKIGKPADSEWNGRNHIKAGISEEENKILADKYEEYLKKYDILFTRKNNEFTFDIINPLSMLLDQKELNSIDRVHIEKLNTIKVSWKDYCLYMLNTSLEPARSNWQNKMISDILKLRFQGSSCPLSTKDALQILTELPDEYTLPIIDEVWHEEDWKVYNSNLRSKKDIITVIRYPQESLEAEAFACISKICKDKDTEVLNKSPKLIELSNKWNRGEIYSPEEFRISLIKNLKLEEKEVSEDFWDNILKGANLWFKENIHSTSSWKRFAVAIIQGDYTLKYLGFVPTYKERMTRRIVGK